MQTISPMRNTHRYLSRARSVPLALGLLAGVIGWQSGTAGATELASKDAKAVVSPVTPAARASGKGFGAFLAARQARKDGDIAAAALDAEKRPDLFAAEVQADLDPLFSRWKNRRLLDPPVDSELSSLSAEAAQLLLDRLLEEEGE